MNTVPSILSSGACMAVTGGGGFIGSRVVAALRRRGFTRIRCLLRSTGDVPAEWESLPCSGVNGSVEILRGNLLSPEDCRKFCDGASAVYHLAAGRGEKSFPDAYLNSVVTTRNLLEACYHADCLRRFVNVSSFAVYSNRGKPHGRLLDENCPVEAHPERRGNAYCFAKVKQEELVTEYGASHGIPWVTVRPGVVYGPGNEQIHGRVGIGTFGLFLHLGGTNTLPLTYVENCADAIALAGLVDGIEGQAFNVIDDHLPTSRVFLRLYKRHVKRFRSLYLPHAASYVLCYLWERYAAWSRGQLPPVYNRAMWHATWKRTRYTNARLKQRLGWKPIVPTREALALHFAACRAKEKHA